MDWEFRSAENGNIALTGEIDPRRGHEFIVAIALGQSYQSTAAKLLQSLADPFEKHREGYVRQWKRTVVDPNHEYDQHTGDGGRTYRLSRCILLSHEDKVFQGAMVASMSIPWGETKGDNDLGGYHLVWTRDLVQSATALLASGQTGTPQRALLWLAVIQRPDGSFPQNSWINGRMYWPGLQLDEIAAPILLAWRLRRAGVSLGQCEACPVINRAAAYSDLARAGHGPGTMGGKRRLFPFHPGRGHCRPGLRGRFRRGRRRTRIYSCLCRLAGRAYRGMDGDDRGDLVDGFPTHYIRINPDRPRGAGPARRSEHHHDSSRQRRRPASGAQDRGRRFFATGPLRHSRGGRSHRALFH
jgi:hypothetical protein